MRFEIGLTQITAFVGAIVGTAAFVLSLLNYFRDRPKVSVKLKWDLKMVNDQRYDENKMWGMITVGNIGRRPIYVSHASLKLPRGFSHTHLVLVAGVAGEKLSEGDKPLIYPVDQEGLKQYARVWRKVRAVVSDSANREYISEKVPRSTEPPSWAR